MPELASTECLLYSCKHDTCRIMLEPVGRSAPGAEGVVDLYLKKRMMAFFLPFQL
jgi:hypothetical protein